MGVIHDSHVSDWWLESPDGQTFFTDFLLFFFFVYLHFNITFLSLQIFKNWFYDFYKLFTSLNMLIHLHYFFFTKTAKLLPEIKPTVGNPCPLYILLWLQEWNGLDFYRSHDSHSSGDSIVPNSQMNIVCNVLHQNIFRGTSVSEKIISYVVPVYSDNFDTPNSKGDVTEWRSARFNRSSCCTDPFRK